MFTGIIEETGVVHSIVETVTGIRIEIAARTCVQGTKVGDSIAVNGCCLTVTDISRGQGGSSTVAFRPVAGNLESDQPAFRG